MKTLFFVLDFFKKFRFLLLVNILLLGLASLIEAVAILTLIPVVDLLIRPDLEGVSFITRKAALAISYFGLPISLASFAVIFLTFNILASCLQVLIKCVILKTKYQMLRGLMIETFEDFLNAKWYFFASNRQGVLLNTFINEIRIVGDAFLSMALFFANIVQVTLYLIVPFYISWRIASISLFAALLFALPFILLGKINYKLGRLNTSTSNYLSSVVQESLSSIKVILGFGNQRESIRLLDDAYNAHRYVTVRLQALSMAMPLMYYPLGLLVVVISLFSARKLSIPISETAALLYSLLRVVPFFGQIPALKNSLDNFLPSYEQVLNLRDSARQMKQVDGDKIFLGLKEEIAVKGLTFVYSGHNPILTNINVRIPKGKMVAFIGQSGAGKSTLIDMIMGFNEPSSGRITIDGVPLSEFNIKTYRKRIGYVPQESILFNMSIKDNLRWARDSATDEQIKEACQKANAQEFIQGLHQGYDTVVGDRGVRLSGGQVQRIAFARAILRGPDILILDEATSSIDSHSERLIRQAIESVAKQTTVIIVAHRLSTIINADYIYVLNNGGVSEEGTYSELIQKNGHFSKMVELQALDAVK